MPWGMSQSEEEKRREAREWPTYLARIEGMSGEPPDDASDARRHGHLVNIGSVHLGVGKAAGSLTALLLLLMRCDIQT